MTSRSLKDSHCHTTRYCTNSDLLSNRNLIFNQTHLSGLFRVCFANCAKSSSRSSVLFNVCLYSFRRRSICSCPVGGVEGPPSVIPVYLRTTCEARKNINTRAAALQNRNAKLNDVHYCIRLKRQNRHNLKQLHGTTHQVSIYAQERCGDGFLESKSFRKNVI